MENFYADIAARTGGNIYIGVVGPVRTGKSTLIKRIMEQTVIPNIEDPYRRERAKDELPQSGSGKTIMTSEPKFVPEEAVEISPDGTTRLWIRMIDSVGYMVDGAVGAEENGVPRMVTTPWYDHEIPMTEAAEFGTKKVMEEHCSIGLVVTTDGSITDIPRADYIAAERRAITDMQATGKPFLVIVNTKLPGGESARATKEYLRSEFGVESIILDCQAITDEDMADLISALLYAFPMTRLEVFLPRWLDALEKEHPIKQRLYNALLAMSQNISSLGKAAQVLADLAQEPDVQDYALKNVDLATGTVGCTLTFPEALFYQILSARAGIPIENDGQLLSLLTELSKIKTEFDKISDALSSVRATGYGIVMPSLGDMELSPPETVKKSGSFGVKLKASAPSIHMIRVDIDTEISPIVGGEKQAGDLISYLSSEDPDKLWQSNLFGRSVFDLVQDGLTAKLIRMPDEVRSKFRGCLTKIVNDGAAGLICIIL